MTLASCVNCGEQTAQPLKCGACKVATYCGLTCRSANWRTHEAGCKTIANQYARAAPGTSVPAEAETERWLRVPLAKHRASGQRRFIFACHEKSIMNERLAAAKHICFNDGAQRIYDLDLAIGMALMAVTTWSDTHQQIVDLAARNGACWLMAQFFENNQYLLLSVNVGPPAPASK